MIWSELKDVKIGDAPEILRWKKKLLRNLVFKFTTQNRIVELRFKILWQGKKNLAIWKKNTM